MKKIMFVLLSTMMFGSLFSVPTNALLEIDTTGKLCFDKSFKDSVSWETSSPVLGTWCPSSVSLVISRSNGYTLSPNNYGENTGKITIDFTKVGKYSITLTVEYERDTESVSVTKTWEVNLIKIAKVDIIKSHGNIDHGTTKTYMAKVLNDRNENITEDVSLIWKTINPNVSGVLDLNENAGVTSSFVKKWSINGGNNSNQCSTKKVLASVFLEASCGAITKSSNILFNVKKGNLISNEKKYDLITDSIGSYLESTIGNDVVVVKSDVSSSVTKTLSGAFTVSGSVTISGEASATVKLLATSVEVKVGVSGTTSISKTITDSVSATVSNDKLCDIRISFKLRQAQRDQKWTLKENKTYSTGFVEKCDEVGTVTGRTSKEETRVVITKENCGS